MELQARIELGDLAPGQHVLDTETKLIHLGNRMSAFITAMTIAREIYTNTGYERGNDEARSPPHQNSWHRRALRAPLQHQNMLPRHEPRPALQSEHEALKPRRGNLAISRALNSSLGRSETFVSGWLMIGDAGKWAPDGA